MRSSEERCHEQAHGQYANGDGGRREGHAKAAAFQYVLFDRNWPRDGRLVVRVRLGHRRGCKMAVGLNQVCGELNGFHRRAADHDPGGNVYFQRERHRASPLFDFRGLDATNASKNKSSNKRFGPIQGCALHHPMP